MVGQVYFCYVCFTKLNFSLIVKLDVLPCLNILFLTTWHVTWSLCQYLISRRIGGEFSVYWSVNEHFRCKLKLSTLQSLEWSSLISFLKDINDQKSNFVEKTAFCPTKIFCEKRDGHSKRERKKVIALHLKRVFAGTATNFSNNGFFPLDVTWPVRSTNSTLKCSGR